MKTEKQRILRPNIISLCILLSLLLLIIPFGFGMFTLLTSTQNDSQSTSEKRDLQTSYYNNSAEPFYINATATGVGAHNWSWAKSQPWCIGNGTWDSPYVIENLTINAQNQTDCIRIKHSLTPFIIRNCTILNGTKKFTEISGGWIVLENVTNGKLINNTIIDNNFFGIALQSSNNITVYDNYLTDNIREGIQIFYSSSENNISNNRILRSGNSGISLTDKSNNNTLSDNIIRNNTQNGIKIQYSYNNTILNNSIIKNYQDGISLSGCNKTKIFHNTVFNNSDNGIGLYDSCIQQKISNNNVTLNEFGITLAKSLNNEIFNNSFSKNRHNGISVEDASHNNTINNNTARYNDYNGIRIWSSNNNTIINNDIGNNQRYGLHLLKSNYTYILENDVFNSSLYAGIYIEDGLNNTLINNTIYNNQQDGLMFFSGHNNTVITNIIIKNGNDGIFLDESDNNRIFKNNISDNGGYGIYLSSSNSNTVKNNTLIRDITGCIIELNCINNQIEDNLCIDCGSPNSNPGPKGFPFELVIISLGSSFAAIPFLIFFSKWRKSRSKKIKAKKDKSEDESEQSEVEIKEFNQKELYTTPPPRKETKKRSKSIHIEGIDQYEQFQLNLEKEEELDQQLIYQLKNEIQEAKELKINGQYDTALKVLGDILENTQNIHDLRTKDELITIINDLIEQIKTEKNQE